WQREAALESLDEGLHEMRQLLLAGSVALARDLEVVILHWRPSMADQKSFPDAAPAPYGDERGFPGSQGRVESLARFGPADELHGVTRGFVARSAFPEPASGHE